MHGIACPGYMGWWSNGKELETVKLDIHYFGNITLDWKETEVGMLVELQSKES